MRNYLVILIPFLFLLTACSSSNSKVSEANLDEIDIIKPLGEQISQELILSLQTELKKAIQSGGIPKAIEVCNLKALPLTDVITKSTNNNIEIKRTTFKYRNEQNAPDEFEEMALNYFHSKIEKNEVLPEFYIQKIKDRNKTDFYYYQPLKVNAVCLNCHGTDSFVTPETKSLILKYYPKDKAIGYNEGEFRGLIRIKFPDFQ